MAMVNQSCSKVLILQKCYLKGKTSVSYFVGFIEPHFITVSVFSSTGAHILLYLTYDLPTLQRKREMLNKCAITHYTTQSISTSSLSVSINTDNHMIKKFFAAVPC